MQLLQKNEKLLVEETGKKFIFENLRIVRHRFSRKGQWSVSKPSGGNSLPWDIGSSGKRNREKSLYREIFSSKVKLGKEN